MKNKHNTMNSSSAKNTYIRMQHQIIEEPEATCMLVEVIAKKSQNTCWETTLNKQKVSNEKIRRVSIDRFYQFVTEDPLAFKKLCEALPKVIDDVVEQTTLNTASNTVLSELQNISPRLLKSLYLLSFGQYEGFGDLNV